MTNQDIMDRIEKNNNEVTGLIKQLIGQCILIKECQDSFLNSLDELKISHFDVLAKFKESINEDIKNLLKTKVKDKFDAATSHFSEVNFKQIYRKTQILLHIFLNFFCEFSNFLRSKAKL